MLHSGLHSSYLVLLCLEIVLHEFSRATCKYCRRNSPTVVSSVCDQNDHGTEANKHLFFVLFIAQYSCWSMQSLNDYCFILLERYWSWSSGRCLWHQPGQVRACCKNCTWVAWNLGDGGEKGMWWQLPDNLAWPYPIKRQRLREVEFSSDLKKTCQWKYGPKASGCKLADSRPPHR